MTTSTKQRLIASHTFDYASNLIISELVVAEVDAQFNDGKTSFSVKDTTPPIVSVYSDTKIKDSWSNFGSLSFQGPAIKIRDEELTWVEDAAKMTLDFLPEGSAPAVPDYPGAKVVGQIAYVFLGQVLVDGIAAGWPTIKQSGRTLDGASGKVTGIMKCWYNVMAHNYVLNAGQDPTLCVFHNIKDAHGSCTVNFDDEIIVSKPVNLCVKDFCSNLVLAGASVYLEDDTDKNSFRLVGVSDNTGMISLGELQVGRTYKLKIIKAGYVPSDVDNIMNDTITIE